MSTGTLVAWGVGLLYVAQVVLVPAIASGKGKDTGVWFLLTMVWVVALGWLSLLGPFAVAAALDPDLYDPAQRTGAIVAAFICVGFSLLPLLAVLMSRGRKRDDYYSRRARRRGRIS